MELWIGYRMKLLLALILAVMSCTAHAQTTGTINPIPVAPSTKVDVPPGGCMPIGLTTSGEIVFPIQCKEFIERQRGMAVEQNSAAVEAKPAATQSEGVAPESSKPAIKPVETVPLPKKRVEQAPRALVTRFDDGNCRHFKSYDPGSHTYTNYDGDRRPCR
jgi:hypothetical protein